MSLGYGTWQTPDGEVARKSVAEAIKVGYRHIDAAACYGNEISVGEGIKASGIARAELFITSKVWNTERGYEKTKAAFYKTCSDLGVDYLDFSHIIWLRLWKSNYNKSVAQLCIRWVLQHDVLPLPKSVTASRIAENKEVFDFEISAKDMEKIDALDNFGGSGLNPDEVDF